jgi:hypothetical protein
MTTEIIVAAFQTWRNGSVQVSGFYSGEEVFDFIEKHDNSGTFATLHTFTCMKKAEAMYNSFLDEPVLNPDYLSYAEQARHREKSGFGM